MIWRRLLVVPLVLLMGGFGVGVYFLWASRSHSDGHHPISAKTAPKVARFVLPGTVIVEQDGNLYRLHGGTFTRLTTSGDWTQPTITPDHQHLIAVKRAYNFSDLYELDLNGNVQRQLTNDAASTVPLNQWAFYPRVSQNGTLYYTFDQKEFAGCTDCYAIDFSIYSMPLGGPQSYANRWTDPYNDPDNPTNQNQGTGGSLQAVPLPSGGLLFSRFMQNDQAQILSQLWSLQQPMTNGTALTQPTQSCYAPALSPDGSRVAMICTAPSGTTTDLVVASLQGTTLGPASVVASGPQLASPTWSPDGKSLLYIATVPPAQQFQLFLLDVPTPGAATPTPAPTPTPTARRHGKATPKPAPTPTPVTGPRRLTDTNDFDATSAPVWF
ncbi:MAG: hypothetical protein WAM30_06855 [Candidatus Dormiibacterota bacterium]